MCCNKAAILAFPSSDMVEESISVLFSFDVREFSENVPKLSGISTLGTGSTPAQALTLDMDQASLDFKVWPELLEHFDCLRITVYGAT